MIGANERNSLGVLLIFLILELIALIGGRSPFVAADANIGELPVCRNYQACGSQLKKFPLIEETIGEIIEEIEASGSSGDELSEVHMLYDEFVTQQTPFDFGADPEIVQKRHCRCSEETEDENLCNFDDADRTMRIDQTLNLGFCSSIQNTIRLKCVGRRHMLRVMGQIHETGDALTDVNDTAAFCACPGGTYQRARIEPWLSGYVFSYRCAK